MLEHTLRTQTQATQFLRVLRIERMLRVEGRLLHAFNFFDRVFKSKGKLFLTTGFVGATVWLLCSSLYYLTERHNPNMVYCPSSNSPCYNRFESIPSSMYFCLLNLFGEFPLIGEHSNAGKVVASFVAIVAVAVFAIPTGIIGSEFQAMIDERRKERKLVAVSSKSSSTNEKKNENVSGTFLRSSAYQLLTLILVSVSTVSFFLSTCIRFQEKSNVIFVLNIFEICCVFVFAVEYLIRFSCSYFTTPLAWVDLLAFLPTCIGLFFTGTLHATAYWRSLRLLRLFKAERVLHSFSVFYVVFRDNAQIFMVLVFVMMLMWLFCSTLMYVRVFDIRVL